ncbi:hypothetical protein [Mastigocoleus sp. MO_188.B34]|uniref:hypothetical protein n=1 Tax=Mastigocoleus sp. MO_188.B34 TaxID=3036635 RepID=UPI00262A9C51|nr:hypothetical protein [Mastigocoleus sp. MO_188.B34]MDJ0694841.1 hypothetical protein [Mastigocoleus sp. MO_188.B34]
MSNSNQKQRSQRKTICNDCAFHTLNNGFVQCTHPDELEVKCSTVVFCNSFQAAREIDSPCVSFDFDNE